MAMSDCEKCWDTPCTCGYDWPKWINRLSVDEIKRLIIMAHERLVELQAKGKE